MENNKLTFEASRDFAQCKFQVYYKNTFLPLSEEDVKEAEMEFGKPFLKQKNDEFYILFDKQIDAVFRQLEAFIASWELLTPSEIALDSQSCVVKLTKAIRMLQSYLIRTNTSLLETRRQRDIEIFRKIGEYMEVFRKMDLELHGELRKEEKHIHTDIEDDRKIGELLVPLIYEAGERHAAEINRSGCTKPFDKQEIIDRLNADWDASDATNICTPTEEEHKEILTRWYEEYLQDRPKTLCCSPYTIMRVLIYMSYNYTMIFILRQDDLLKSLAYLLHITNPVNMHEYSNMLAFDVNLYLKKNSAKELTPELRSKRIHELYETMSTGASLLYLKYRKDIPRLVDELRRGNYSEQEIKQMFCNIFLLRYYEMEKNGVSACPSDAKQTASSQTSHMQKYVTLPEKADAVLKQLHWFIDQKKLPREKLAPLKAAMECKPKAIDQSLPYNVFHEEFDFDLSESTYKNWIFGYHDNRFDESELEDYKERFAEIMSQNL